MTRYEAILLLGPTGSGKTPLGDLLAERGLLGRRCAHLDFGAQLRRVAEGGVVGVSPQTVAFVREVLRDGLLLENETFPVARAVLESWFGEQGMGEGDLVVLNGLPRHVGQARDVGEILDVVLVVALECTPALVRARIAADTGGDRAGRTDDSLAEIERKLATYEARTRPLIDHYRAATVPCRPVGVGVGTTAHEVLEMLAGTALGGSASER